MNASLHSLAETPQTAGSRDRFQFGRQSILDNQFRVYGFELLYRPVGEIDRSISGEIATARIIGTSLSDTDLNELRVGNKPLFINMTKEHLMNIHLMNLPPDMVVYEILEDTYIDDRLIDRLKFLRGSRFRFALDDFTLNKYNRQLIPLASFIKLDVQSLSPLELKHHVEVIRKMAGDSIKLVAEKVETNDHFLMCQSLGFDLYQGFLFEKPQLITGYALHPSRSGLLRVEQCLNDPDASFSTIAGLIAEDPALLYKLLRFCGNTQNTHSVVELAHLIEELGKVRLRIIISLFSCGYLRHESNEVIKQSLLKALHSRQIARDHKLENPEQFYLAGLLSEMHHARYESELEMVKGLPIKRHIKQGIGFREGQIGKVINAIEDSTKIDPLSQSLPESFVTSVIDNQEQIEAEVDMILAQLHDTIDKR